MRVLVTLAFAAISLLYTAAAQTASVGDPAFIPAGKKIVLSLKQAISTRNAKDGDPIYAETVFPVIAGDRVAVPSGTPMQGVVFRVKHAGKFKGHPQIGIRFTAMIREDGSVVALDGQLNNAPGGERLSVDQTQSSIVGDRQTRAQVDGEAHAVTTGAFRGTFFGLLFGGTVAAMRVGAGLGMAGGLAFAILGRPTDMRLRPGTQIQITLQSPLQLNGETSIRQETAKRPATTVSEVPNVLIVTDDETRRQP